MINNNEYYFKLNDVGDALAYIVSIVENEEFIYTTINTHTWGYDRFDGMTSNALCYRGIINREIKECNLCVNKDEQQIWQIKRYAHIFENTLGHNEATSEDRADKAIYLKIFKDSSFPYLDEFIEILEQHKKIAKKELEKNYINLLAFNYVQEKYPYDETEEIKRYTHKKTIGK
jgi:hypothetical protein